MLGAAWKIGMACRVALYSTSISSTVCSSSAKPCKHPINCLHLNHKASMLQFKWPWRVLLNGRLCFRAFQSVVVAAQPTSLYTSYEHIATQTPGVPRLNEEQLKAVEVDEKCVRVVAGPGSGKTLVLTQRIAHLVMNKKHEPSEILCITFTNKAAKELRRRLEGLVGYATIENMTVGTFHSVCAKLLRKFVSQTKVGISSNFVIYDRDDCQRILKRSLVEVLCSSDETSGNDFWLVKEEIKRFLLKDIRTENENIERELMKSQKRKGSKQNIISSQDIKELLRQIHRARRLEMEEFVAKRTGKYNLNFVNFDTSEIGKLAKAFERSLRRNNAADFDDLIYLVVRMLHEHPDLIEICEKRWTCVLVDEFQDTDGIQYELIRLLCKKNKHLFVVGDVDQAIYGWRGSEIYHMQNSLQNDFPSIKTLQLQHNYRSSNHILKVASEIIENSAYDRRVGSREGLKLHGIKHSNVPVQVCSLNDADMEAQYVVNEICKLQHISSIEIEEFAILYRTHYQAFALEKALITAGMPYKIHGSMPFYSHKEINVLIAYLQYIVNTQDEMAFECIINTPPRGCTATTCERNWSVYSLIHTKRHNRLSTTQLERLVYVNANLKLLERIKRVNDPMLQISCDCNL